MMDVGTERQHLLEQLRQHADPEYQAAVRRTVPTGLKVYGLRVPQLRDIVRTWGRAHQQVAFDDLVALVEALWNGESREERMLFTYLLEHYKHLIPDLTRAHFERWRRDLDNWEMTDGLGWVLAFWLLGDTDTRLDYLGDLIADEDVWSRRLALVTTTPINRGHADFTIPDLTLELVDRVKEERHPMITKAVSWALQEMTKSHPDQVAAYLEENREVLAAHVVREVNNKLRTGLKSGGGYPMRFALSTGSLYTYGLDRVFALAAEAGFDGIEVLVDPRFDTRQPVYLRRLMERYGLPILSVHAPFRLRRLVAWPKTQPESIAATAELARAVGADVIIAHLPYFTERAYMRWLRNDLRAWQRAHTNPVVAVENMPLKWIRWWPFAPLEMWRMNGLEEWGAFPHLTLDTTHLGTKGLDPLTVYEHVRERVVHVHLSNALREGRRVREHRRLEDGFLALGAFISRLAQDGYAGIATVELEPEALEAEVEQKVRFHLRQQIAFCRGAERVKSDEE